MILRLFIYKILKNHIKMVLLKLILICPTN
jgi:hypothetical protein